MKKNIFLVLFILIFPIFLTNFVKASGCPDNSSFDELSQSCKCSSGYTWEGSQCVKFSQYCIDTFGDNSKYNSVSAKCECSYGYIAYLGQCINANSYCQDKSGPYSVYDSTTKSCKCDYGYLKDSSEYCVTQNDYCNDIYGNNSEYNKSAKECVCKQGYVLSHDNCIDGDKYCQSQTSGHSRYDISSKSCECDSDYKLKNSKCQAIEILGISQDSGFVGDEIKIIGNNFGDDASDQKIYIGSDLIDSSDILSWKDDEITFKIEDGFKGGNIILKTSDGGNISGPSFSVSIKTEASNKSGESSQDGEGESEDKITLNQQINITNPSDASDKNNTTVTASVASNNNQPKGVLSFVSNFLGSIFDGFVNVFSALFGRA